MGNRNAKKRSCAPASENQRPESERTPETHGIQPSSEASFDVAQKPTHGCCAEDGVQELTQEAIEDPIMEPTEGMEGQGPQETSIEGTDAQSLAGTSGSSDVDYGVFGEANMASELVGHFEALMVKTEALPTPIDFLCQECQECMLGESSGDSSESSSSASTLEHDLYSTLMAEPWISPVLSQMLLPPVELLDSWNTIKEAEPWKELEETGPNGPGAEGTGAQANSLATQQPPESAHVLDAASQMVPVNKDAVAGAIAEENAEIQVCSRALEAQEKGENRAVDGPKQEATDEPPKIIPSASWVNLDAALLTAADTDPVEENKVVL